MYMTSFFVYSKWSANKFRSPPRKLRRYGSVNLPLKRAAVIY